ncbi:hypothetical protein EXS54_00245 [Patescibacteria group bacterium]|nr:hypothetical protein [Patescibacteria group bacterium]
MPERIFGESTIADPDGVDRMAAMEQSVELLDAPPHEKQATRIREASDRESGSTEELLDQVMADERFSDISLERLRHAFDHIRHGDRRR